MTQVAEQPVATGPSADYIRQLVPDPILTVRDLKTWFPVRRGVLRRTVAHVKAVDGVNFNVPRGQTLGLVGESGCGKTTVGRTILRLIPATSGEVRFNDTPLFELGRGEMRRMRRNMQIIFQDPVSSLNPRMTVGAIVGEPLRVHGMASGSELADRVESLLKRVGLSPEYRRRYPHEFSGGQRQRIGIARALALEPELIICDEPVSALDVSIQSQILNLLGDLQDELGLSYLFIAHNLAVIEHFCDVVAVMYLGRIVEMASAAELYDNPRHPYTMALLSAAPHPMPGRKSERIILRGEVPSPMNPPGGCPFHPRCHMAQPRCGEQVPQLEPKAGQDGHVAACLVTE
ncbi:MAG: Vitamin B12 import ATP-binding protein BtuD [Phycisphaerae bacterium]|nr:Vitamin B12 import ATP-binding protein BtuD [Phycisphaerae bacterium]